jgi:hypothetical protein
MLTRGETYYISMPGVVESVAVDFRSFLNENGTRELFTAPQTVVSEPLQ